MKKLYLLTKKQLDKIIEEKIKENEDRISSELQTEIINKQINLMTLQSQINPHFLYNAFECVRGRAIIDNAPIIADMVQAMANYFRYSISSKSDIVTLKDELNNIQDYLKIQQFRFNNRFDIDISYDESDHILDAIIPKLTLQPIIENSIFHGFEKKIGDAKIKVDIISTMKNINIVISDNGIGMSNEKLLKLNNSISGFNLIQRQEDSHVGLAMPNIDKRLKLFFGEDYGVHVSSIEGIGTDVEIHIPFLFDAGRRNP